MHKPYLELSYFQVGVAALLILVNGAVSVLLKLGLGRRLLVAAVCTVVQLLLVGLVLEWVFRMERWYLVLAMMLVMTLVAGIAATQRTHVRYPGIWVRSFASVWAGSWLIAAVALTVILRVRPWYAPQYAIPLLGMILGNTLNGVSLGLDRLGSELGGRRHQVEAILALGATRWEAARPMVRNAVQTGLIPTINSMMVVGIVSLPGMMTGQILAGASPVEAVKYQIVIMFLIASATAVGTVAVVLLSYRRLFNERHQFQGELITEAPPAEKGEDERSGSVTLPGYAPPCINSEPARARRRRRGSSAPSAGRRL